LQGALISADYKLSLLGLEEDSPRYNEKIKRIHLRSAKRMLKLALTQSGVYIKVRN
jgi:aarF domain-containing kinase